MRSNNMWRRFFAMAAAVVLAVAAMVPAAAMADVVDDLASTSPAHEKTLEDNGDGTYDLTLSVSREYLALPDGPGWFTQDSSCPALLRIPLGFN